LSQISAASKLPSGTGHSASAVHGGAHTLAAGVPSTGSASTMAQSEAWCAQSLGAVQLV
jgi:hypothetical protein